MCLRNLPHVLFVNCKLSCSYQCHNYFKCFWPLSCRVTRCKHTTYHHLHKVIVTKTFGKHLPVSTSSRPRATLEFTWRHVQYLNIGLIIVVCVQTHPEGVVVQASCRPVKFFYIKLWQPFLNVHTLRSRLLHLWCWILLCFEIITKSVVFFFSQVRLQTQAKPKPGESLLYAGTIDCFKKTLAKEVRMPAALISGIW